MLNIVQLYLVTIGALTLIAVAVAYLYHRRQTQKLDAEVEKLTDDEDLVDLQPPDVKLGRLNTIQQVLASWYEYRKRRRLAKKGYVQWYVLDGSFPTPKYVKPDEGQGGIPEYEYDGATYGFPRQARVPDARHGIWTMIHRKGEWDPVNPNDPNELAIKAKEVDEYLTEAPISTPPGFMDTLKDLDPRMLLYAAIGFVILFSVISGSGGIV